MQWWFGGIKVPPHTTPHSHTRETEWQQTFESNARTCCANAFSLSPTRPVAKLSDAKTAAQPSGCPKAAHFIKKPAKPAQRSLVVVIIAKVKVIEEIAAC